MEDHARSILGNLVQTKFYLGQNFTEILQVLEDVVAAAVVQSVCYPQSNLVGNNADDVLLEFSKRVRGKTKELEGILRLEMELQEQEKRKVT